MSRTPPIGPDRSFCLEEALERRLERRLRRIDRLFPALSETPYGEPDPRASLQALSEKVTRLRLQGALLHARGAS